MIPLLSETMMSTIQEIPPKSNDKKVAQQDAHRDPLSGRAGAHPVGTGVGAAAGGMAAGIATGAAIGTVAGPVGTAVGAAVGVAVGAIGGGLAGKAIAEEIDPTVEHGFWRECYANRSYIITGLPYDEYAPAYEYGWVSQALYEDKSFDHAESTLQRDWDKVKGSSKLHWDQARHAVRDSWNRVTKPRPVK
jgi:hypothetical protein